MAYKLPTTQLIEEASTDELFEIAQTFIDTGINSAKLAKLSPAQTKSALWDSPLATLKTKRLQDILSKYATARLIGAVVHTLHNKVTVEGL